MKKLITVTSIVGAVTTLALITACQTTTGGSSQSVSQTESLLAQSGFKVVTATTPKQQQAVTGLPDGKVSTVKYNGKLFYVYPTAQNDKFYVGKQQQFNAFKSAAVAQQNTQPAKPYSTMDPPPTMTFQTHGQNQVVVDQFQGFGPMGTAQLGDW